MLEILMMVTQVASAVDLNAIWDMIIQNGVFAGLFVWLLVDSKKDSKNREERLLNHIERQGEALDKVTDTIERMDIRLSRIEDKVDKKD
ncbi:BhlA/UviB family holin-like peptide [Niallia circulans]|uniref:BhlA/UviB family holin-like peptide n=1 Tax=Niallia circulans TaxID=1397 RepID=UPI002E1C40A7|nr:BhlA/UviB family holin-like peptide [Niallia circulans]